MISMWAVVQVAHDQRAKNPPASAEAQPASVEAQAANPETEPASAGAQASNAEGFKDQDLEQFTAQSSRALSALVVEVVVLQND